MMLIKRWVIALSVASPLVWAAPAYALESQSSILIAEPIRERTLTVPSSSAAMAKLNEPHGLSEVQMPLVNALIMLFYPVAQQVVDIDSPPELMGAIVDVEAHGSRQQALDSISEQTGYSIRLDGSTLILRSGTTQAYLRSKQPVVNTNKNLPAIQNEAVKRENDSNEMKQAASSSDNFANSSKVEIERTPAKSGQLNEIEIGSESDSNVDSVNVFNAPQLILEQDGILSELIEDYAKSNNIDLVWQSRVDYKIRNTFSANKPDALENIEWVLRLYDSSDYSFEWVWYANPGLLIIKDHADSSIHGVMN